MLLWLSSNDFWIKCVANSTLSKFSNSVFHARITQQNTICLDHNTSHLWLMLQLFRPRLGIWSDLQRGTFFTHIKTLSCSPEPEEYKYKHHLKFLHPDELNSKNKWWLVNSGTEPFAHSFSNGFFICCEVSCLFYSICFLEIWVQYQSEVVNVSGMWGRRQQERKYKNVFVLTCYGTWAILPYGIIFFKYC